MKLLSTVTALAFVAQAAALAIGGQRIRVERDELQDIVTYDEHSLLVNGERIFVFGGEFHPYRLPVPDLWLDVFQKIKALGFNTVSFYVHWALLEGEPGVYRADGIFAFEPFFDAAKEAGIYLIARPGPYINAESSGGGFPGWLQRVQGQLRTRAPDYLAATDNYAAHIGATIAKGQITNGGPIILFQPENEYSLGVNNTGGFPDPQYFAYVKKQFRDQGIIVPFINNDAWTQGLFAPGQVVLGTTEGDVDIYGHDSYPLGFDCANPTVWPAGNLPTYFAATHEEQSPSTPYAIPEFQGGAFDPWGGLGFEQCSELLNHEFERVFYKNNYASGIKIFSVYMTFGGTNWGNLGHAGGYTSYDYGSPITEGREIYREKYSELKIEAQFLKVSPAYLTASVGDTVNATYASTVDITTTPLWGNGSATNFYIVRHSDYQQQTPVTYKFSVKTASGTVTIPQLGGSLTLSGRDSKWHVTDYDVGGTTLQYSTAEILTWKKYDKKTILVVYGGPGEQHELSVISKTAAKVLEGTGVTTKVTNGTTILNWQTSTTRRVVQIGNLFVYVLDRNTAYNYWVPDFAQKGNSYSTSKASSVIVQAGYLVRTVEIQGSILNINGDLNATVPFKLTGAPASAKELHFNGKKVQFKADPVTGEWSSSLSHSPPKISLPDLSKLTWKYIDNLPELQSSYDDSLWTKADHTTSNNTLQPLWTPTSLFGSDYGYHPSRLVFRGNFVAEGTEKTFYINSQGGFAFGSSVWLNDVYIGSWKGIDKDESNNSTYTLPNLVKGKKYTLNIVVDNNGMDGNWVIGYELMKAPRGILNYTLSSRAQDAITWKLTGNLGGEKYIDKVRGPLNEGGLYAERNGYHLPSPPTQRWASSSPLTGINKAGIAFYSTSFKLDLPQNYDIPLKFAFQNTTNSDGSTAIYRAQLWVNGYQFGKYTNNIGPQLVFPVPQGILNYQGENYLAVEIWAQQAQGAHLKSFTLQAGTPVLTSMDAPKAVPQPAWSRRPGAY